MTRQTINTGLVACMEVLQKVGPAPESCFTLAMEEGGLCSHPEAIEIVNLGITSGLFHRAPGPQLIKGERFGDVWSAYQAAKGGA